MIIGDKKQSSAISSPDFDTLLLKDCSLNSETFYRLTTYLLLNFRGFRVRNLVTKSIKKGKLVWPGENGPVTIQREDK